MNGAQLLDDVDTFLARFVAFPTAAARTAVTLWAAHCHALDAFESTPRLALLSPEKGSGKTRTLEVLDLLVPTPMHTVNMSAAALFRQVADKQPTLLMDECDTYLGWKVAEKHEELRGLVNAGHRRGAVAYRVRKESLKVDEFPAFAAAALAGIGDLPDTIIDRSIVVRMKRRALSEKIVPFRHREAWPEGDALRARLATWTEKRLDQLKAARPELPAGIVDRAADVWEPLFVIATEAGADWLDKARAAAVEINAERAAADPSLGVQLLRDLHAIFEPQDEDNLASTVLVEKLCELEESPWGDLRGRPLDARGLARRLRAFEIRPHPVRTPGRVAKGYNITDFFDAWQRYLPVGALSKGSETVTSVTRETSAGQRGRVGVTQSEPVTVTPRPTVTDREPVTRDVTAVTAVTVSPSTESAGNGPLPALGPCESDGCTETARFSTYWGKRHCRDHFFALARELGESGDFPTKEVAE